MKTQERSCETYCHECGAKQLTLQTKLFTEEEIGQYFMNHFNCYAQSYETITTPAMTKERFIKSVKQLLQEYLTKKG